MPPPSKSQPTQEISNKLEVVRRDSYLTEFTFEENWVLVRGYEVLARLSPSSDGRWKVSWAMHSTYFDKMADGLYWMQTNGEMIAAPPFYPRDDEKVES